MLFSPLVSGSSGNSTFIEAGGVRLLVDAGLSAKRITQLLEAINVAASSLNAILVTHEHSDHIAGIRVLSTRNRIPVYLNEETYLAAVEKGLRLDPALVRIIEPDRPFYIQQTEIFPFTTPHDSAHSMGFAVRYNGSKCAVMTDTGCVTEHMLAAVENSDILLMEANHDVDMLKCGSYPASLKHRILSKRGHLSNDDAALALLKLFGRGIRNVILGHMSLENNTPELAKITVETVLKENGIYDAMHIELAKREEPTGLYEIGE